MTEWRQALRHPDGPPKSMLCVLLTLSTFGDADGDQMYPSIFTLGSATGLHWETVRRVLQRAAASGWVIRLERESTGPAHRRYAYLASMPARWRDRLPDRNLNAWQRDPEFTSERFVRNRDRKPSAVPAPDREPSQHQTGTVDQDAQVVPASRRNCPGLASSLSLPGVATVPVSGRATIPSTFPMTSPVTAPKSAVTRDAVEAVSSPGRALKRADGGRLSLEEQTRKAISVLEAKPDMSLHSLLRMYPLADPQAVSSALQGLQGG